MTSRTPHRTVFSSSYLATEGAGVLGMLGNLDLFDHFPQRRAVTCPIFTHDPHLLGALGLWRDNDGGGQLHLTSQQERQWIQNGNYLVS